MSDDTRCYHCGARIIATQKLIAELKRLEEESQKLQEQPDPYELTAWLLDRFTSMDHGCITGECPHEKGAECVDALVMDFALSQPLKCEVSDE